MASAALAPINRGSRWHPPAPRSERLDFDAYQRWQLVDAPGDTIKLQTYIVDRLEPMPGSASL